MRGIEFGTIQLVALCHPVVKGTSPFPKGIKGGELMSTHLKAALVVAGATLLAVHGVLPNANRDLSKIEDLMSQVANYVQPLPNSTASERGHQQRMRGYFESKLFLNLKRQTFLPVWCT